MKRVISNLSLKATADGGKRRAIVPPEYRCPVFFEGTPVLASHGYDCRILLGELGAPIAPGETASEVPIVFLFEEDVLPHLVPGTRFTLWEGRTIGSGEVLRIED